MLYNYHEASLYVYYIYCPVSNLLVLQFLSGDILQLLE